MILAHKSGRGAFRVTTGRNVWIEGYGDAAFASWQDAADHCRHIMAVCGAGAMADGSLPYFGAANALEAILETGEAE